LLDIYFIIGLDHLEYELPANPLTGEKLPAFWTNHFG